MNRPTDGLLGWLKEQFGGIEGLEYDPSYGAYSVGDRAVGPELLIRNPDGCIAFLRGEIEDPDDFVPPAPPQPLPLPHQEQRRKALHDRVEKDMTYHRPTYAQQLDLERITAETKKLAHLLVQLVPEGRDLSIALTSLEDVRMRANKGIVTQGGV